MFKVAENRTPHSKYIADFLWDYFVDGGLCSSQLEAL